MEEEKLHATNHYMYYPDEEKKYTTVFGLRI